MGCWLVVFVTSDLDCSSVSESVLLNTARVAVWTVTIIEMNGTKNVCVNLPLPFVEGGSRLLSSLGRGEPPFVGAVVLGSFPSSCGCRSDTMLCVHNASSTMCGDHFLPQPFCS